MRHCKSFYFEFRKFCVKLQFYNLFTVGVSQISRPLFPHLRNWHYSLSHRFLVGHTEIIATETQRPTSPHRRNPREACPSLPHTCTVALKCHLFQAWIAIPCGFPVKVGSHIMSLKLGIFPYSKRHAFTTCHLLSD